MIKSEQVTMNTLDIASNKQLMEGEISIGADALKWTMQL